MFPSAYETNRWYGEIKHNKYSSLSKHMVDIKVQQL